MKTQRMQKLYNNMLNHISELVSGVDLVNTLHAIGFSDDEIKAEGLWPEDCGEESCNDCDTCAHGSDDGGYCYDCYECHKHTKKYSNNDCPYGGDIENDCADCADSVDYHFCNGECVARGYEHTVCNRGGDARCDCKNCASGEINHCVNGKCTNRKMTGMRKIIAILEVDDDLAIKKDLGTIDFLEKELASIEGVYLQEAKILDEDDECDARAIELASQIFEEE